MPSLILGVDCGICGALAFLNPETGDLEVMDMPVHQLKVNNKKKRRIDLYELARLIDLKAKDVKKAFIENPSASPGMGVVSAFQFGYSCGAIQAIVAAHFISMKLLPPATWKKAMQLPASKDACRKRASELMPRHCGLWSRALDDGRAEASLLAWYGAQ